MTTKAERERLLQGQDPMANQILAFLTARGWEIERLLRNVALKRYKPHEAVVRVEFDSEYQQYWVGGQYVSEGNNVLATCFACIKATATATEVEAAMAKFLRDAENNINQSFAVRFLGGEETRQPA